MMHRTLRSILLLLACPVVVMSCSTEGRKLWADDLAELTDGVAIASKTGLQPQQSKPSADAFVMAGDGQLNAQQVKTVVAHLAWPQSYEAIYGKLGNPSRRDDWADYYVMPNGHSLTVYYTGGVATGYSLGDSGE